MLFVRAPGRVNLIGEHIDYNGLSVLPMAIQRHVTLLVRPRTDRTVRVATTAAGLDPCEFPLADDIPSFPTGHWGNYVKAASQALEREQGPLAGFDAVIHSTVPVAAGLSSSSALVIGVALALLAANRRHWDPIPLAEAMALAERYTGTQGGGIHCGPGSSPLIKNNTIIENYAGYGGGLLFSDTSPTTKNNILWNNHALLIGPQIYTYYGSTAVTYCDVQDGWTGEGNIDCDPFFCNPECGNFHLSENSCCIGAGMNGEDIGALGIGCGPTRVVDEYENSPDKIALKQNYLNPFNARTTIEFIMSKSQDVELTVYDLLGRQIEVLIKEPMDAGVHNMTFEASSLSSGVYFYRLRAGDAVETKRMVLLK